MRLTSQGFFTSTQVRRAVHAFTLVEILIVVVILGILAAVVVPQFARASSDAQVGNIRVQRRQLQGHIDLYRLRTGAYPTLAQLQVDPANGPAGANWGLLVDRNYFRQAPKNPFNGLTTIGSGTLAANGIDMTGQANFGWAYDAATGSVSATYYDESGEIIDPTNP